MNQTRLSFDASEALIKQINPVLENAFEEDGFPVAAFEIDENKAIWSVSVYVPSNEVQQHVIRMQNCIQPLLAKTEALPVILLEELEEDGWIEKTLRDLNPVRAGRFVVHGSHDMGCAGHNEHSILIDAGMAFGTGHHGTTAGCLAMIDRVLKKSKPERGLDLGSGTGVLALAIAKSARIPVLATDIDPVADEVAKQNIAINGESRLVKSITATGFNHRSFTDWAPFDLVVANILAGPLQALAPDLAAHLEKGAYVILSGLLPHQKARILAAYRAQGIAFEHAHYQNGWMTLVLRDMRKSLKFSA